jgi:hypothetical protein
LTLPFIEPGEFFLLTLPFIERRNRKSGNRPKTQSSGYKTYQACEAVRALFQWNQTGFMVKQICPLVSGAGTAIGAHASVTGWNFGLPWQVKAGHSYIADLGVLKFGFAVLAYEIPCRHR